MIKDILAFEFTFPGASAVKNPHANAGDAGSIPGLGRSPGGGHGNPLQYSYLENPHDLLAVQGTIKSLLQHHSSKASISLVLSLLYGPTLTAIHD